MPVVREEFHHTVKGSLGEDDDWWRAVLDTETGKIWIEHEWSHMNPYRGTVTSEGTEDFPLEQFTAAAEGAAYKAALDTALERLKQR